MKIRPVGTQFPHADGRTDGHDEANSRFSQFSEGVWRKNYENRNLFRFFRTCRLQVCSVSPDTSRH